MSDSVVITGVGLEIPGLQDAASLFEDQAVSLGPDEFDPRAALGRKNLLGKDRATLLGMSAAKRALEDAGLATTSTAPQAQVGVAVASNLGNVDTVCRVSTELRAGHVADLSVLDLPNASSNVIASNIAVRFRLRAPNFTICSGSGSGAEALYVAHNTIRANRAKQMLVVGVEPKNEISNKLLTDSAARWLGKTVPMDIFEGAAAVLVESAAAAAERNAQVYCEVSANGFSQATNLQACVDESLKGAECPWLWSVTGSSYPPICDATNQVVYSGSGPPARVLDVSGKLGESYGWTGVLQAAQGAWWLRQKKSQSVVAISGGFRDEPFSAFLLLASQA